MDDERTRLRARIAELDNEIANYPTWDDTLAAMNVERWRLKGDLAKAEPGYDPFQ